MVKFENNLDTVLKVIRHKFTKCGSQNSDCRWDIDVHAKQTCQYRLDIKNLNTLWGHSYITSFAYIFDINKVIIPFHLAGTVYNNDIMAICVIYLLPSLIEKAPLSHSSFSAGSSRWFSGLRKQKSNWFGHLRLTVPKPSHRSSPSRSPSPSCSCSTGASPSFSCPFRTPTERQCKSRVCVLFYMFLFVMLKLKF